MSEPLRAEYEVTIRVDAPVSAVWEEIETLDRLLARAPEVVSVDPHAEPDRALWHGRMVWGRLQWTVEGDARVLERKRNRHLLFSSEIPTLDAHFQGIFVLAPGASDVTVLGYRGSFVCRHRLHRLMKQPLTFVLKDHVETVATRVGRRAAQHARFEASMERRKAREAGDGADA
jgi:carbon monoxide dehydrogenase subunit G